MYKGRQAKGRVGNHLLGKARYRQEGKVGNVGEWQAGGGRGQGQSRGGDMAGKGKGGKGKGWGWGKGCYHLHPGWGRGGH